MTPGAWDLAPMYLSQMAPNGEYVYDNTYFDTNGEYGGKTVHSGDNRDR